MYIENACKQKQFLIILLLLESFIYFYFAVNPFCCSLNCRYDYFKRDTKCGIFRDMYSLTKYPTR